MLKNETTKITTGTAPARSGSGWLTSFRTDEAGGAFLFILVLISMMLLSVGMALDFMRHEALRSRLQDLSDRIVLACASLTQTQDCQTIADDYVAASGLSDTVAVNVDPDAVNEANRRRMTVTISDSISTTFLALADIGVLDVSVESIAEEANQNVEVSLVLDISQSMGKVSPGSDSIYPRAHYMKEAAKLFVREVLEDDTLNLVSVNLVPYAGHVNIAPFFTDYSIDVIENPEALASDDDDDDDDSVVDSGSTSDGICGLDGYGTNGQTADLIKGATSDPADWSTLDDSGDIDCDRQHYFSSCIEFVDADWDTLAMPSTGIARQQVHHFDYFNNESRDATGYTGVNDVALSWGWCPGDETAVVILENDIDVLEAQINGWTLYDGTGTQFAFKYGLALLNPASNGMVGDLGQSVFSDRPLPWPGEAPAVVPDAEDEPEELLETKKYIVVMTDGQISDQWRPAYLSGEDTFYKDWHFIDNWEDGSASRPRSLGEGGNWDASEHPDQWRRNDRRDRWEDLGRQAHFDRFLALCDQAKDANVTVFTVAMDLGSDGSYSQYLDELEACATNPDPDNPDANREGVTFFDVEGAQVIDAFNSIAATINRLKLSF